jgi:hypothetical protein
MNSTTFMTKAEILLYSSLTSAISGIDHLKTQLQHIPIYSTPMFSEKDKASKEIGAMNTAEANSQSWETVQQILLSLLLWTILGFAAGFFMGMIKPG